MLTHMHSAQRMQPISRSTVLAPAHRIHSLRTWHHHSNSRRYPRSRHNTHHNNLRNPHSPSGCYTISALYVVPTSTQSVLWQILLRPDVRHHHSQTGEQRHAWPVQMHRDVAGVSLKTAHYISP